MAIRSHTVALTLLMVLNLPATVCAAEEVKDPDPARFAKQIAAFAEQDQKSLPDKGGMVFVGSSSVRMLKIPKYFPGLTALNRGFGGAHICDVNHYAEQTVLKYEPATVVFFCGNNDLWGGKLPEQVREDFQQFTQQLFQRVPQAKLLVLAIRPSPQRIRIIDIELKMNAILRALAAEDDRITYLPGSCDRFLDDQGQPIGKLYATDRLHMNDAGYRIWQEILTPLLLPKK